MSQISDKNKIVLARLVDDYNALPRYKKRFFPRAMSAALRQYNKKDSSLDSALAVCNVFLNKTWFFQRWFLSSLVCFSTSHLAYSLKTLTRAGLLTGAAAQANFNAVLEHEDPQGIATALAALKDSGLLTGDAAQANFNTVLGHKAPGCVADALDILIQADLFTEGAAQANFNTVVGHQDPRNVVNALATLSEAGLLAGKTGQSVFNTVVITHPAIMSCDIWVRIPGYYFTQVHFNAMTQICEKNRENIPEGQQLLIAYVNREILGIGVPQTGAVRTLNPVQSTYTASAYVNVMQSAQRLIALYDDKTTGTNLDPLNASNRTELEAMVANVRLHEGMVAAYSRRGGFFNANLSSVGAAADIGALGEGSPKP